LTFDVLSNKTVDVKGAKMMIKTSGNEKTRYTVVVCCADGTKLPPLLIFKRKMLPEDVIPRGIYVHVHSKGWMDGWRRNEAVVREVWSKCPDDLLRKPSLLMCKQFRAHVTESTKSLATKLKSHLAVIPGG